jgi:hypothetical protein
MEEINRLEPRQKIPSLDRSEKEVRILREGCSALNEMKVLYFSSSGATHK